MCFFLYAQKVEADLEPNYDVVVCPVGFCLGSSC